MCTLVEETKKTYGRLNKPPTGEFIIPRGAIGMAMRAVKNPVRIVRLRRREILSRVSPKWALAFA
jgi:hypothetical protein